MQARRLPARHGFLWLAESLRIFRRNPPLLTALTMTYMFVMVVINLLPLVGPFLLPLALPTLIVILANGCRAVQRGSGIGTVALTFGIKMRRIELVRLGGLHLLGSIIILFASTLLTTGSGSPLGSTDNANEQDVVIAMAKLLILALPVIAAFWFAPLLTAWDDVAPAKAVFFSFVACWRNWQPFAVYGLLAVFAAVVVPGLLLILSSAAGELVAHLLSVAIKMVLVFVIAPVMMASVFVSYQDVFHGDSSVG